MKPITCASLLTSCICAAAAAIAGPPPFEFEISPVVEDGMWNNPSSLALDEDGFAHVAFMQTLGSSSPLREIYYATNETGEWVFTNITNNAVREEFPALIRDDAGVIHITFHSEVPGTNKIRYVNNSGGDFSNIIDISGAGFTHSEHGLDSEGNVHFCYISQTPSVEEVYYRMWSPTTGLGTQFNISNTPGGDEFGNDLAVGPDDVVHLVYQAGSALGGPLKYTSNLGGSFVEVPTGVVGNVTDPIVLCSNQNVITVIYCQADQLKLVEYDQSRGVSFSAPIDVTPVGYRPAFYEGFALDDAGRRYVAYASNVGGIGNHFTAETESGFTEPLLLPGTGISNVGTSIAVNSAGKIAVTYQIGRSGDKGGPVKADMYIAEHVGANPCPADFDGDGSVGSGDLAILLGAWAGPAGDLDGDMTTGASDLALALGAWGPCP